MALNLKYLQVTQATCLPVRTRLPSSFSLNEDSPLEVSVGELLEPTRIFRIEDLEVRLQLDPMIEYDFRSAMDIADSISLIHIIGSIGRLALEDTSLLKLIRQILKFLKSGQASGSSFFSFLLGSSVSPLAKFSLPLQMLVPIV